MRTRVCKQILSKLILCLEGYLCAFFAFSLFRCVRNQTSVQKRKQSAKSTAPTDPTVQHHQQPRSGIASSPPLVVGIVEKLAKVHNSQKQTVAGAGSILPLTNHKTLRAKEEAHRKRPNQTNNKNQRKRGTTCVNKRTTESAKKGGARNLCIRDREPPSPSIQQPQRYAGLRGNYELPYLRFTHRAGSPCADIISHLLPRLNGCQCINGARPTDK